MKPMFNIIKIRNDKRNIDRWYYVNEMGMEVPYDCHPLHVGKDDVMVFYSVKAALEYLRDTWDKPIGSTCICEVKPLNEEAERIVKYKTPCGANYIKPYRPMWDCIEDIEESIKDYDS